LKRLTPEGPGIDVGLLLAPAMDGDAGETCTRLLTTANPGRTNVLFVTTRPADRRVAQFRSHAKAEPNEIAVVALGRAASGAGRPTDPLVTRYATVGNPSNLTRVGVEVTKVLSDWAAADVDVTVCLDSATALLQYADERVVFRFLAELVDRCRRTDAWAHVHLDPAAHEPSTVSSLLQLFDVVVDRTGGYGDEMVESLGGEWLE